MNQAFEAWLTSLEKPITGMHTGKLNEYRTQMCKEVWQGCSQHYEAKIAEMQAELDKARELLSGARDAVDFDKYLSKGIDAFLKG